MGRHTLYTPELFAEICRRISLGEPLEQICRDEGMPSSMAVHAWVSSDRRPEAVPATIADDFARAREAGHDAIAADCLAIADDSSRDWQPVTDPAGNVVGVKVDGDHVQRSKLRIETRLKLLAKWSKKYSDKIDHTHAGPDGGPMRFEEVRRTIVDPAAE